MNKHQKIFLASTILIVIVALILTSYTLTSTQTADKLKIVTTFYPLTYLTQQIGGDYVDITQLMPQNTDIHSWEPSVSHIMATEDADIIFYNGAGADHWMEEDILPAIATLSNKLVVKTTHGLTLAQNCDHDHPNGNHHYHDLYDPHTWVSPYMAKLQAENIYNTLITADPQHENYYTQRWHHIKQQLEQLDATYLHELSNTDKNTIFVSHEAFGYLAARYGFTQHGVIGLSADQQPSITTISNIVDEMRKHQIYVLYFDPIYSDKYVQTIKTEVEAKTGQTVTILKLYLMIGPIDDLNYLEQMQTNLTNLQTGLKITL